MNNKVKFFISEIITSFNNKSTFVKKEIRKKYSHY